MSGVDFSRPLIGSRHTEAAFSWPTSLLNEDPSSAFCLFCPFVMQSPKMLHNKNVHLILLCTNIIWLNPYYTILRTRQLLVVLLVAHIKSLHKSWYHSCVIILWKEGETVGLSFRCSCVKFSLWLEEKIIQCQLKKYTIYTKVKSSVKIITIIKPLQTLLVQLVLQY